MSTIQIEQTSTFARLVDRLRFKSEDELKLLYLELFGNEIGDAWEKATQGGNLEKVTDDEVVKAVQKKRYPHADDKNRD